MNKENKDNKRRKLISTIIGDIVIIILAYIVVTKFIPAKNNDTIASNTGSETEISETVEEDGNE